MAHNPLPEPLFYTANSLAERWKCEAERVYNYVLTEQLKASVLSRAWWIEAGFIEDSGTVRWQKIPCKTYLSDNKILDLTVRTASKIVMDGHAHDPDFEPQSAEYQESYLCCSSRHYPSDTLPDGIIVRRENLIFRSEAVLEFERGSDLSDAFLAPPAVVPRRTTLKQLELHMPDDAMPFWQDYFLEHKCEPSRDQTATFLQSSCPEKYGNHKYGSIVRHLSLKDLKLYFSRYRNNQEKEGKRISS